MAKILAEFIIPERAEQYLSIKQSNGVLTMQAIADILENKFHCDEKSGAVGTVIEHLLNLRVCLQLAGSRRLLFPCLLKPLTAGFRATVWLRRAAPVAVIGREQHRALTCWQSFLDSSACYKFDC